ncbi:MAG: hypothetical protein J6Z34_05480, partial [Clostridia bacterium]|nr:hypothetical protein [Clostridia bacterium]
EQTSSYTIVTAIHLNHVIENMLGMTTVLKGMYNIYELNEDMTINQELKAQDIEKYGLYTYEEWSDYLMSYEQFVALGCADVKVAVGKGMITTETIFYYIEWFKQCMESGELEANV